MKRYSFFLSLFFLVMVGCDSSTEPSDSAPTLNLIGINAPLWYTVNVGVNGQFTATANFSDGSTTDVTSKAAWTSSDQLVCTVSATGFGLAIAAGEADICATDQGVKGCQRLIVSADAISLDTIIPPLGTTLSQGQEVTFSAAVSYVLETADTGYIQMIFQDENNAPLLSSLPNFKTISRGVGTANLSGPVTIPPTGVTTVIVWFALFPAGLAGTNITMVVPYSVGPATKIREGLNSLRGMGGNLRCVQSETNPARNTARVLTSCVE